MNQFQQTCVAVSCTDVFPARQTKDPNVFQFSNTCMPIWLCQLSSSAGKWCVRRYDFATKSSGKLGYACFSACFCAVFRAYRMQPSKTSNGTQAGSTSSRGSDVLCYGGRRDLEGSVYTFIRKSVQIQSTLSPLLALAVPTAVRAPISTLAYGASRPSALTSCDGPS